MDIVFMGTPDFAVPSLVKLNNCDNIQIKGVVTQPDRKKGRGQKVKPSPVKKAALKHNLDIYQVENINNSSFVEKIKEINPEAIVVVAFGQKVGSIILDLPEYGCINLHASLLPQYRGASPIHQAIINGDKITGVTTMYMDEDWDKGDIIYRQQVEIKRDDNVGNLHDRLAEIGAKLLVKTLVDIENGNAPRTEQDNNQASYAYKLSKEIGKIDWGLSAEDIFNLVRGVNPWPGAYTYLDDTLLKIWKIKIVNNDNSRTPTPGKVVVVSEEKGLIVQTGQGLIKIESLQLAGRKRMSVEDFLRGYDIDVGTILGK